MTQITAPYGFVPLSEKVVFPSWLKVSELDGRQQAPPLHDVPFQEGLSGILELEIEAETPIFTRDSRAADQPFKLWNGRHAIPGTALRGALRNVVEIITFSRFARVNDHRYAVRDLQNRDLYGQHMADIVKDPRTGKGEPMPLVNAGWLTGNQEDGWAIEVCDFAKIEYRPLQKLAQQRGVSNFRPGDKQSSKRKYETWGRADRKVEVNFISKRPPQVGRRQMLSRFGLANPEPKGVVGTLVFTGQPSRWTPDETGRRPGSGKAKHHDFVFLPAIQPRTLPVSKKAFEDFEFAHSDRGQQNRLGKSQEPNEEWGYWLKRRESEPELKIPVFFLTEEDGVTLRAMGLAMMFRLSYRFSVGESIANVSKLHQDNRLDFAEGLFGTVRDSRMERGERGDDRSSVALKGRVGISHALAQGSPKVEGPVDVILGSPKASYYPNYVEQSGGRYRTFMDRDGRPRGWKRYRALSETWKPIAPTGADGRALDASKVGTRFRPLAAGTRFVAHVDVHNLLPQELGALLWALDFGGHPKARHMLGMARPLGYGRCRLSLKSHQIQDVQGQVVRDLGSLRQRFEAYMEQQVPGWKQSFQIQELLALAQPVPAREHRYQRLDPGNRINEFVDHKKAGLWLPYASRSGPQARLGGGGEVGGRAGGSGGHGPARGGPGHSGPRPGGGHSGGRGPGSPGPRSSGPPSSPSGVLAPGSLVEGVLLAEKTKKGGWKAKALGSSGPILNSAQLPADAQPGQTVKLKVRSTTPRDSSFDWVP